MVMFGVAYSFLWLCGCGQEWSGPSGRSGMFSLGSGAPSLYQSEGVFCGEATFFLAVPPPHIHMGIFLLFVQFSVHSPGGKLALHLSSSSSITNSTILPPDPPRPLSCGGRAQNYICFIIPQHFPFMLLMIFYFF